MAYIVFAALLIPDGECERGGGGRVGKVERKSEELCLRSAGRSGS